MDVNGNAQKINRNDGDLLSTASGCFGLLGLVTRLTLLLDKMTIAFIEPTKVPAVETIPPPSSMVASLPEKLKKSHESYTQAQIQALVKESERRAFNEYYAESFWFPLHDQMWINTWSQATEGVSAKDYPSKVEIAHQITTSFVLESAQEILCKLRKWFPESATKLLCM